MVHQFRRTEQLSEKMEQTSCYQINKSFEVIFFDLIIFLGFRWNVKLSCSVLLKHSVVGHILNHLLVTENYILCGLEHETPGFRKKTTN